MGSISGSSVAYRDQALRSLDQLPPFSPILNRLLAGLANENVSFAELAELLEKDTVLAGNVLRLVNSALYGRRGTINSLRHAVAIIGLVKLRNTVLGLSVSRMWTHTKTPAGWSSARFNLHSVAAGILSDLLAQQLPVPYTEGAFVAGLLHDIGKLLIAIALGREYEAIQGRLELGGRSMEECELDVIGLTHAELSAAALARWNIPSPIQKAAEFHHVPDLANRGELHLSHVVRAADRFANELGLTILPSTGEVENPSEECFRDLGLDEQIPRLREEFQTEFEFIRAFF